MAFLALSRSITVETDGPHFQYYSDSLGTTINISIPKGRYYTAVPDSNKNPSLTAEGTIAYVINQALAPYFSSFYQLYYSSGSPTWYYSNKLYTDLGNINDYLKILNTPDAKRLAWALGWIDNQGAPAYTTVLGQESYLHPVMGYLLIRGGVLYTHALTGFKQYNEDIIIGQDGFAVALASDDYTVLNLQVSDIERDRIAEYGFENTTIDINNDDPWFVKYDFTMNPFVFNSGGGYLWVYNESKDELKVFKYKGFANKIQSEDVQTVVDNWLQLYNLNINLTGVEEV